MKIEFGVLAPPLKEQLKHTKLLKKDLEVIESDNVAINRLYLRCILTERETDLARKRLVRLIQEKVNHK